MILPAQPAPAADAVTNGLRAVKPPLEIPSDWAWLGGVLAALLVAALITGLVLWLRRARQTPPPPPIPPHVRARQRLEAALALLAEPKPFVIEVSDTLRGYLEERFNFRAPERTTEEFLRELSSTPLLNDAQKLSLADFLQRCDLVKFARYEPTERELRDLHTAAVRLVNETEPGPEFLEANAQSAKAESEKVESGKTEGKNSGAPSPAPPVVNRNS